MKDVKIEDLIPKNWELKTLTAYDKKGHKLWEWKFWRKKENNKKK